MKLKKFVFYLFIILLTVCYGDVAVFAMNTGFSTNEMNIEVQQAFLSNINLSLINDEPKKDTIVCFDVSNSGLIAIGTAASEQKYVFVYNSIGEFQYGYAFHCNQSFGIQWDDANLMIYFVRSDVAALFDSNGTNLELRKIENTIDNNSYWNHSVFSKEKTINENRYTIKNNMGLFNGFAISYSQLIKTDPDGNETIIYDVNAAQTAKMFFVSIAVLLFVAFAISAIIWQRFKAKR